MKKRVISVITSVILMLSLVGCGQSEVSTAETKQEVLQEEVVENDNLSDTEKEEVVESDSNSNENEVVTFSKTAVQSQDARYIPIGEVSTYNKDIITDELLANCSIEDVDISNLPYWTGYILENKACINQEVSSVWELYTPGADYFCEEDVRYLKENEFNCVRTMYSFSNLSNPDDIYSINEAELEQLDELLSWCIKYDITLILSVMGMPGKKNTSWDEENVACNTEVLLNPDMREAFQKYWMMISKRYADIPNGIIAFELMAEPEPDREKEDDAAMQDYYDAMMPIVTQMQKDRADRVIIAEDLDKKVPEKLAEMGCCLSLHTHVYYVDNRRAMEEWGIDTQTKWPMPYLPMCVYNETSPYTICAEDTFEDTVIQYYIIGEWGDYALQVTVDGVNYEYDRMQNDAGTTYFELKVPNGAKEVTISSIENGWFNVPVTKVIGADGSVVDLVWTYAITDENDVMPTLQINKDGSVTCLSGQTFDSDFIYDRALAPFVDCAKKNNVSFIMSEVGTDTESLSVEDYLEYHEMWLEMLHSHKISWMYNCQRNVFAPLFAMWLRTNKIPFENFTQWENTAYYQCDEVIDLLKKYSK